MAPASLHLKLRSTSSSEFEADTSALNKTLNKTRVQIQVVKLRFDQCLQVADDDGKLAFFRYTVTTFQRDRVSRLSLLSLASASLILWVFSDLLPSQQHAAHVGYSRNLRTLCSWHRQLQPFEFRRDTRILIPELAVLIHAHRNDVGRHVVQKNDTRFVAEKCRA